MCGSISIFFVKDDSITITLEGSSEVSTFKSRVKTFKGLDKAFLNKIKELSEKNISKWKMDEISVIKANAAIKSKVSFFIV